VGGRVEGSGLPTMALERQRRGWEVYMMDAKIDRLMILTCPDSNVKTKIKVQADKDRKTLIIVTYNPFVKRERHIDSNGAF
jgi:hypothetical protein